MRVLVSSVECGLSYRTEFRVFSGETHYISAHVLCQEAWDTLLKIAPRVLYAVESPGS
jgi:hypothetical protein